MSERCGSSSTPRNQIRKVRVARLASRQLGRISHAQLIALGAGKAQIARWRTDGYLYRVLPGVYAVGHLADSPDARLSAALLYAGPGAMLSHATAACWWGLLDQPPVRIEVSIAGERLSLDGVPSINGGSGSVSGTGKCR